MKTWVKILIVAASGAAVWALAYCGTLWPDFALVLSSAASTVAMACGAITGFTKNE